MPPLLWASFGVAMLAELSWSGFFEGLLIVVFTLVSIILVLIVLVQKGRGGGLAGAFGGGGGNTAFGAKTGDVLTWATSVIFGVFLLLAIALNWMGDYRQALSNRTNPDTVQNMPAPAQRPMSPTPTPAPTPAPVSPTTH
jgi:preprotein translocase subunit SecG